MKRTFLAALVSVLPVQAAAMTDAEIKEMSATIINVNGFLCARVTSINPTYTQDVYRVHCVEYRNGSGFAVYLMNARTGGVIKE